MDNKINKDKSNKKHERKGEKVVKKEERDQTIENEEIEKDISKEECDEIGEKSSDKDDNAKTSEEEDNKTRYLRLAADFANFKKRSEKEKNSIHAYANEVLVTDMLDILDNFERAFLQESCESDPFMEGMGLIYKQLLDVLGKSGLSEIIAKGQPFDPEFHDALMVEASTEFESGTVLEVFKKGYMMKKKVIRPSLVKVAQ